MHAIIIATIQLIILHTIDGRDIGINPAQITSMRESRDDNADKYTAKGVRCLVNLTDGKYISVKETCDEVRTMLRE